MVWIPLFRAGRFWGIMAGRDSRDAELCHPIDGDG